MPTCPAWSSRIAMAVLAKSMTDSSSEQKSKSLRRPHSRAVKGHMKSRQIAKEISQMLFQLALMAEVVVRLF